jgi:hypothetical protein
LYKAAHCAIKQQDTLPDSLMQLLGFRHYNE